MPRYEILSYRMSHKALQKAIFEHLHLQVKVESYGSEVRVFLIVSLCGD